MPATFHNAHTTCCLSLQTTHQDAIASLQAEVQQAKEAYEALQQQLATEQAAAAQQQEQFEALQAKLADVQAQLSEWAQRVACTWVLHLLPPVGIKLAGFFALSCHDSWHVQHIKAMPLQCG